MASWFRSWHGAPTDNKWLVIARRANVSAGVVSAVVLGAIGSCQPSR